jgi:hypothetical protein
MPQCHCCVLELQEVDAVDSALYCFISSTTRRTGPVSRLFLFLSLTGNSCSFYIRLWKIMAVVKKYVLTRLQYHICGICLQYHICGICLSLFCHQRVILSEVPDCSGFSRINADGYGKILYLYILTFHDYYLPSSVDILILHSKVRSYGYVHVTGLQLSCM